VRVHEVAFASEAAVFQAVRQIRPDWIFHLAAYGAYPYQTNLAQMVETNIVGTINLVGAGLASGFESFVNTGSSSEYGSKGRAPSEMDLLEPNSHYAVTKASGTLFCRYTAQSRGARLPTLRLYSVYGPYEEPTRLMPTLAIRGLAGELPPLVHPAVVRDFVFVDDVIDAYILAADRSDQELGAVYNVGTSKETTLHEIVDIARRVMHITAEPRWGSMPDRAWDSRVWVSDNRLVCEALDWKPRFGVEMGFRKLLEWFNDNPGLVSFYRDQVSSMAER
jgi:dolichol-phosphate mannosyltransferase